MHRSSPTLVHSLAALTAAIALALSAQAHANGEVAANATDLDTVVVTATGAQQWIRDAPASISVITRQEIERKPVSSIGQLLSTVPGVTGGYALSGAQSKIRLRGLPEQYTLILIDGRRQGNSSGVNYRDDLGPQDLNWLSPDMIERIEVVRGPMSSLYGSDAMGGVINIITRKIGTEWGGSVTYNYSKPDSKTRGNTTQMGGLFSGPLTDNLGLRVGANVTDRESDRGRSQTPGNKAENANALLNWAINGDHMLGFEASHGVQQQWRRQCKRLGPVQAGPHRVRGHPRRPLRRHQHLQDHADPERLRRQGQRGRQPFEGNRVRHRLRHRLPLGLRAQLERRRPVEARRTAEHRHHRYRAGDLERQRSDQPDQ